MQGIKSSNILHSGTEIITLLELLLFPASAFPGLIKGLILNCVKGMSALQRNTMLERLCLQSGKTHNELDLNGLKLSEA